MRSRGPEASSCVALAAGVDREALEGALEAGGRVLGIAPEGVLQSRWPQRREVREGRLTIVSEFAPDDRWSAGRAMGRNKTIAGFSSVLVIADCVASGGTTDQLEVHRAAGLAVYVRRGPGEGAMVDELCRRPGVTPWYWAHGPLPWPPPTEAAAPEPASPPIACVVKLSPQRVHIEVDAPRQLAFDVVLATVRAEYERASDQTPVYPPHPPEPPPLKLSEPVVGYEGRSDDLFRARLRNLAEKGASARELEQMTGLSKHRVRKRLNELVDAGLVSNARGRFYDASFQQGRLLPCRRRRGTARGPRRPKCPLYSPTSISGPFGDPNAEMSAIAKPWEARWGRLTDEKLVAPPTGQASVYRVTDATDGARAILKLYHPRGKRTEVEYPAPVARVD